MLTRYSAIMLATTLTLGCCHPASYTCPEGFTCVTTSEGYSVCVPLTAKMVYSVSPESAVSAGPTNLMTVDVKGIGGISTERVLEAIRKSVRASGYRVAMSRSEDGRMLVQTEDKRANGATYRHFVGATLDQSESTLAIDVQTQAIDQYGDYYRPQRLVPETMLRDVVANMPMN